MSTDLNERLQELRSSLEAVPVVSEPPKPTLRILGSSRSEQNWNTFLAYFLSPSQPHGFDAALLKAFLNTVQQETELDIDYYHRDIENIEVDTEVSSPQGNRPDIVIRAPGEWFVCIESKVEADEGEDQLQRYLKDAHIGSDEKSEFREDGQHYLFLSKASSSDASAEGFEDLSWWQVVETFEGVLRRSHGRYPARSANQLEEFLSTVIEVTNMEDDDFTEAQKEKVQLLAKYKEDIDELFEAANQLRQRAIDDWPERFQNHVNEDLWTDEWHTRGGKWGILYRDGWYLDGDLNPTTDVDETRGNDGIRLHFMHYIRDEDSFLEGELKFELVCNTSVPVREQFYQLYTDEDRQRELKSKLDKQYLVNNKSTFTRRVYDVDQSELPESYFETLATAFEDHLPIVETVDEILNRAVENTKQG